MRPTCRGRRRRGRTRGESDGGDAAAELVGEQLHAVADAEDGEAGLEDPGRGLRGAFVVDAGGAAGEDEAARVEALDVLPGGVVGDELAVDVGTRGRGGR